MYYGDNFLSLSYIHTLQVHIGLKQIRSLNSTNDLESVWRFCSEYFSLLILFDFTNWLILFDDLIIYRESNYCLFFRLRRFSIEYRRMVVKSFRKVTVDVFLQNHQINYRRETIRISFHTSEGFNGKQCDIFYVILSGVIPFCYLDLILCMYIHIFWSQWKGKKSFHDSRHLSNFHHAGKYV